MLAYRVTDDGIQWEDTPVADLDVETLLRPGVVDREEQSDAEAVIRELLADAEAWPLDARQAIEAGQAHGIPERTMRWTAKRLGITIRRTGFGRGGKWLWHRPAIAAAIPASATPQHRDVASIAGMRKDDGIEAKQNIEATKSPITSMPNTDSV